MARSDLVDPPDGALPGSAAIFYSYVIDGLVRYVRGLAYAHNLPESRMDAEGTAHEAITRTLENWATVKVPAAYAYVVARHLVLRHVKLDRYSAEGEPGDLLAAGAVANSDAWEYADPADVIVEREFLALLDELSESQREATFLKHIDGWSSAEIAQHLGCAESTVGVHIHRGVRRLEGKMRAWIASAALAAAVITFVFLATVLSGRKTGLIASQSQTPLPATPRPQNTRLVGDFAGLSDMTWVMIIVGGMLVALGIGAVVLLLVRRHNDDDDDDD